jgi:hypothetical protein
MADAQPMVSVLLPTFNRAQFSHILRVYAWRQPMALLMSDIPRSCRTLENQTTRKAQTFGPTWPDPDFR